jgi:hypothetical protein
MKKYITGLLLIAFAAPSWAEGKANFQREYNCILMKDEPIFFRYKMKRYPSLGVLAKLKLDDGESILVEDIQSSLLNPNATAETFFYREKGGAIHFYKISLQEKLFPEQTTDDYLNLTLAVMEPSIPQPEIRSRKASSNKEYIISGKCTIL